MFATLRKCVEMLSPALRRRWLVLVPLAFVTSGAEVGAASAIFVLLGVLTSPTQAMHVPWVASLVSWLPRQDGPGIVLQLTGLVSLYYIAKSLVLLAAQYVRLRVAHSSSAYLASEMLRRYLSAPYPFHFRRNSAELIRNCTSSVGDVLGGVLGATVALVSDVAMSVGLVLVLVTTSPGVTVLFAALVLVTMIVVLRLTRHAAGRLGGDSHELSAAMLQGLQQAFGGIKEVKVLGHEQFFYDEFVDRQRRLLTLGYLGIALGNVPSIAVQMVLVVGAMAFIAFLTINGATGAETIPVAGIFGYAGVRILPMANAMVLTLNGIRASRRAVDELYEDFVALESCAETQPAVERELHFRQAIALDRVAYAYPGTDRDALTDVSLTIRRGESIGIVGPTGAGKSTLVDLILGLLPPTRGRVTVDGVELGTASRLWKRRVGYVPQSAFLIDDTLRKNVALGMADDEIDDDRVHTVVAMAQLGSFLGALPEGLDARVGERGVRLSGGERQRVAIARALYHDPDVIVFDEATASLDVATEADVTSAIEQLRGVKTLVVIAHRLSTVRHCDRLVWLRDGRVAGVGSFDELRGADADFRHLAALASV
jgi:ATP-binding cassette, subfamily B, bacterial PglK